MRRWLAGLLAIAASATCLLADPRLAGATTAAIGPDGNVHVDGEPFLPIGIVHVSWIGDRQGKKAVADLHEIADAGFNLLHATVDARPDMAELFDAASARGVLLMAEIPWPPHGPAGFVNPWKSHPALVGWNILDDFNAPYSGPPNHPVSQAIERRDVIRSLAPGHLVFASGGSFPGFRIAEYAGAMDVMGFQSYPVSAGNNDEPEWLEENADSFDWVRDQLAGTGQVWLATPQAFRWKGGGTRWPTPGEERNMVYDSLARGAKGVLYYAFWGENGVLSQANPALWGEIGREVRELRSLAPFLLHGTRSEIATGEPRIKGALWEHRSQVLVVLLSTDRATTHPVAIDLPPGVVGPAHRIFPDRPETGMGVSGGDLVGDVGPDQVHVYLVDVATTGARPVAAMTATPPDVAWGEVVTLDGSASSDPDGVVESWTWDLGDGSVAEGPVVDHTYASPGSYAVRLTVRDDAGNATTIFQTVAIGVTSLCAATPAVGCRAAAAGRSRIDWRSPANAARRKLDALWIGEVATAELGDPRAMTEVALCVYDAGGRVLATGVRPDATAWRARGLTGFRYRDRDAAPAGLDAITLQAGPPGRGQLRFRGKGASVPALPGPLVPPVRTQVHTSDGGSCFESSFAAAGVSHNDGARFKAR